MSDYEWLVKKIVNVVNAYDAGAINVSDLIGKLHELVDELKSRESRE